jgi:hypothetical protein
LGLVRSQVGEVELAGPQPAQLHEVLGVEEQLVHLGHLINGESARPVDQVVEVLEGGLRAEADVVGADDAAAASG